MQKNFLWIRESTEIQQLILAMSSNKHHNFKFVGGCVRDSIINPDYRINNEVEDLDMASDLTPEENMQLLSTHGIKTIATGLAYGTITATINSKIFHITSLRQDMETDGRRAVVSYTKDFYLDSLRRDFTFNALYLDCKTLTITDYHNGIQDLKNGRVVFIGNPADRIQEDYLRILRFFRFYTLFGKDKIPLETLEIIKTLSNKLSYLSKERVSQELFKILSFPTPAKTLQIMLENSIFSNIVDIIPQAITSFESLCEIENITDIRKINIRYAFILANNIAVNSIICKAQDMEEISKIILIKDFIKKYQVVEFGEICQLIVQYGYQNTLGAIICIAALDSNYKNHYIEVVKKVIKKSQISFPITGKDMLEIGLVGNKIKQALSELQLLYWLYPVKSKKEYISHILQKQQNKNGTI